MRRQNDWVLAFLALLLCRTTPAASSHSPQLIKNKVHAEQIAALPIKGAKPDRLFEFGIAFGVPIFISPEVAVQIFKQWQVGSYFGMVPTGILPRFTLPKITEPFFNGLVYELNPTGDTSLLMASPFVRFFPTERTFYFQLTWSVARSTHNITSPLRESVTGLLIPDATVNSLITITEMLPTVSIGYFFWSHVYFFNICLGATIPLTPAATATLSADLPLGLGGTLNNQVALNNIQSQVDQSMSTAITEIRKVLPFLPSVMVSTGIMF
jgi:hypothetical protein